LIVSPVLLAAAATLPFQPPSTWTPLPSSVTSAQVKNVWQSRLSNGNRATFTEVVVPLPIGASTMTHGIRSALEHSGATVSSQPVRLCGAQGELLTAQQRMEGQSTILLQQIVNKGGYTYMLMYSRPQGTPADPAITAVIRGFCPSGTAAVPTLGVPANWKAVAGSGLHTVGMWLGTQPMQTMVLMKGPHMSSLSQLMGATQAPKADVPQSKYVRVVSTEQTSLCGLPAIFVRLQMNVPAMPMSMQQVVTQSTTASYGLMYAYPSSEKPDPAAIGALHTLCATGTPNILPSAQPASTAAPMPSAAPAQTPAASPAPSASPR